VNDVRRSRLLEEIRQGRPFRSKTQEAFLTLLRTADVAKRRFTEIFEAEGITFQQYNVLRILRGAGEGGLPTLDIGERMIERQPGITRMIDRLERKSLVVRNRCVEDRRRVLCSITPEGLALLERLDDPVDAADRAMFATLSDADVQRLVDLLDELRGPPLEGSGEGV
jgi:DNA-binding MarR family transcriptional regulator